MSNCGNCKFFIQDTPGRGLCGNANAFRPGWPPEKIEPRSCQPSVFGPIYVSTSFGCVNHEEVSIKDCHDAVKELDRIFKLVEEGTHDPRLGELSAIKFLRNM